MKSNQNFPFQLESEIIHGTFSTRGKNANHIVWGALLGKVSVVYPPPQLTATEQNSSAFLELTQVKQIMDQNLFI